MNRKLMSLMLVFVLVFSMTACSKQTSAKAPETVSDIVELMSEIELNTANYVLEMDMGDEGYLGLRFTAANKSENEGYVNVDIRFSFDSITVEDYTYLTTMYVDGTDFYINLQSILDFMTALDEQFAMVAAYLALPGDYLKITADDLTALYEGMGIELSDLVSDLGDAMEASEEDNQKLTDATITFLGGILNELAEKSNTALINGKKAVFTINSSNIQSFMDALAAIDMETYLNDYAAAVETIPSMASVAEQLKTLSEGLNDQMISAAENVDEEDFENCNISFVFGLEDRAVEGSKETKETAVFDLSVEAGDEASGIVNVGVYMDMTADKAEGYTLPESVMSYEDLITLLTNLGII